MLITKLMVIDDDLGGAEVMFALVDSGFLLWVPVGAEVGPGEGLVESWVDGSMLGLQRPLVLGLVEA